MFSGSIPALITPFRDGAFDEEAFRRLIDWQIENGSAALVPCGTTGEAPTLSNKEHHHVIAVCVEQAAGRVPVIAGCGSNNTQTALRHLEFAQECGADAALCVAPYYNRPTQAGLIAHFSFLAERCDLPIVLYNVPGRTVTDIRPETVIELANAFPDVFVGLKDASGDLTRPTEHRRGIPGAFAQLCGDDPVWLQHYAAGGVGCISVTANVAPRLCADLQAALDAGDFETARELDARLYPLHRAMFTDASPGPVKYALSRVHGWLDDSVRLPIIPASTESRKAVDAALAATGVV
ncbi:MAG: 4-hydroxy-tetrahydrodipicolinate synthase [Candidatus Andeanibacterium colombiense]|uniref:4-hydroxy-tetrahydrodipicolinate synthase n=1 Tax=Candidatus Andeanibacterium colombiense TaxID=3121345 RepID=A0AAJ5X9W7_9SPHN|nr:MAG: 4-hydroxy-tetrahydrodipicolinate synthase [Sphingomonadaceae bacterium]